MTTHLPITSTIAKSISPSCTIHSKFNAHAVGYGQLTTALCTVSSSDEMVLSYRRSVSSQDFVYVTYHIIVLQICGRTWSLPLSVAPSIPSES